MWASRIGDKEIMMDRVTEPVWAYMWIESIGDKEIMEGRVVKSHWIHEKYEEICKTAIRGGEITKYPVAINDWNFVEDWKKVIDNDGVLK
jgi:hypothetical protein